MGREPRSEALVLFPAFLVAEATMSFAGLGFPSDAPSWGTLPQANVVADRISA